EGAAAAGGRKRGVARRGHGPGAQLGMSDETHKPCRAKPSVLDDVGALAKGLKATLGEYFSPQITTEYPEEKSPRSERYRGRHYLRRYDNGPERCIGCELCAAACPVVCILVAAA